MTAIKFRSCYLQDVTIVSNEFLDRFLPTVNGDFLRIYLYLLRASGSGSEAISISSIADRMNCTEKDVERALRFFEREGVLTLGGEEAGCLTDITFLAGAKTDAAADDEITVKSSDITTERMTELGSREDIRELLFIAQQYVGKPLSRAEMQRICYFYDVLHFSPDLIDYLIEYCVSRGHKSFHYIEKVALSWKKQGVTTVHDAQISAGSYHREYYDILKALGIDNHHPVEAEIRIMKKWIEKYEFPMDLIREACTRTVMGAAKPSLSYADSILSKWYSRGVHDMADVLALDSEHEQETALKRTLRVPAKKKTVHAANFEQRSYDYNSLESALLGKS